MLDKIKEKDMFGHSVSLNYKREGNTHNTLCGGIVSMFIYAIMLNLVVFKTKTMILVEDDTIIRREKANNDIVTEIVSLADMDLIPAFGLIANQRGKLGT